MKTLQIFLLACLFTIVSNSEAVAQSKKAETFDVSGNCGMCKSNIEKAAKAAGASYASWSADSKKLTVKYAKNTSAAKIQQKIAEAGYDNAGAKASDEAYNKLHGCCQYERTLKAEIKTAKDDKACASGADCCK
ncbi:copper chaperone [Niabella hibiscisoli]|uniref:copper chaperone n=1 Tax=Niabella hibiscisoli TaxID=1825928 RepID=UPI001F0EDA74|nr:copper chaperone [Niabella hibiscisoli]MCH5715900.1 copper chaperone [Niabella hibiscisoli]